MTVVSALVILSLASFLGGVTKGVTGFGSAILNLCTWIAFKSCTRLDTGTLTQAVVCEALSSTLIAPGLLYVTRAYHTADFRLVAVVAFFVTVSSPIGAAVLAELDAQQVELAMAFVLLAIIIVEHTYKLIVRHKRRKKRKQGVHDVEYDALTTESGSSSADSSASSGSTWLEVDSDNILEGKQHLRSSSSSKLKEPLLPLVDHHDSKSSSNINSIPAAATGAAEKQAHSYDALDDVTGASDPSADVTVQVVTSYDSSTDNAAATAEDVQTGQRQIDVEDPTTAAGRTSSSRRRCCAEGSWIRIVSIYSVAGLFSGVMEGLTGMNGPPLMIAYRSVNTPKATVRGSNAFLNLLQFRLVPYWYMGLITGSDLDLYVYTCATGLIGALIGNALSWKMNQAVFQKVLGVLMILCCFLMFISGLGILK